MNKNKNKTELKIITRIVQYNKNSHKIRLVIFPVYI
jgi:hypothetical protein